MFDLNGDGDVDVEEFEKVTALIRQRTSIGARHREHSVSANSLRVKFLIVNNRLNGSILLKVNILVHLLIYRK
jgi:hypothetical protein